MHTNRDYVHSFLPENHLEPGEVTKKTTTKKLNYTYTFSNSCCNLNDATKFLTAEMQMCMTPKLNPKMRNISTLKVNKI